MTPFFAEWCKVFQELGQDGSHEGIFRTILSIKVLEYELGKDGFDALRVVLIAKFRCEEHLTDTFDCYLTQDSIFDQEIVVSENVKEVRHLFFTNAVNYQPIYDALDCDNFLSSVIFVWTDLLFQDLREDLAIVEEYLFIQDANETDALEG